MPEILFWVYLTNSVLLINHEIDSAYWEEWDLFKLPGGLTLFLIVHYTVAFSSAVWVNSRLAKYFRRPDILINPELRGNIRFCGSYVFHKKRT